MPKSGLFIAVLLVVAGVAGGCSSKENSFGFIELKNTGLLASDDKLFVNSVAVTDFSGNRSIVVRHASGTAKVSIQTKGQSYELCQVTVKKSRVQTVNFVMLNGKLTCRAA
jgi:hypothetical protein